MSYWKIESLEKHLEVEKENGDGVETITMKYINHLETQLKLMKQSFNEGRRIGFSEGFDSGKKIEKEQQSWKTSSESAVKTGSKGEGK